MKKLGLLLGVVALLVPSLVLAGDIKIGLMCPLTGKWASEGQDMKNIVSLLVDETNAKGGINGSKVELVVEDDAGDPRTAALAAVHDPMPLTGLGPAQGLLVTYDARERRHLHGRVSVQKMHDAMQGCLEKTRQAASSEDIWLRPFARRDEKERTRRQLALEKAYLRPPQKASRPQRTQTADALRQGLPA